MATQTGSLDLRAVKQGVTEINQTFLYTTAQSVNYDTDGGADPTSITLSSTQIQGGGTPSAYSGRFKVETTTDNTNWTATYTSSSNESSKTFSTPTNITDTEPYCFRAVPSGVGDVVKESAIVGGTVAWNQLWNTYTAQYNTVCSLTKNADNDYTLTSLTTGQTSYKYSVRTTTGINLVSGHKLAVFATITPSYSFSRCYIYARGSTTKNQSISANATGLVSTIVNVGTDSGNYNIVEFQFDAMSSAAVGTTTRIKNAQVFDLTQMFGSTIADYIYSLETATAGAGVAYFRKLFPKSYYAYNAGELMSVKTSGKRTTGFNILDTSGGWEVGLYNMTTGLPDQSDTGARRLKDKFRILPNTQYYANNTYIRRLYYDSNDNFISGVYGYGTYETPTNAYWLRLYLVSGFPTGTMDSLCINISKTTGSPKNGDYVPYDGHTYALSDTELRGVPKLVSNKLVYDGDTYSSDGGVTRKYGIVNLGSLTWTYNSTTQVFYNNFTLAKRPCDLVCSRYPQSFASQVESLEDKHVWNYKYAYTANNIVIKDTSYSDAATFKTAMNGVYLVYELATPTTETAQPFTALQAIDSNGTEEYIDTRDVAVPVGHTSTYISGVKAIRASLYKAGGTSTLLAQTIIPCGVDVNAGALALANDATKTATKYITQISDDGIKVHAENNVDSNYAKIDADGMEVYKGGTSVASYGDTARIGKPTTSNEGNVYVDSDSVDIRKGATVLSTFTASGISLGKNSTDATITLASDSGSIKGHTWSNHSTNDSYNLTISNDKTITTGGYKALVLECDYPNHNDTKIRLQTGEYQNSPTDSILLTTDDESLEIRNGRITANSIQVSTYENFIQVTSLGTAGVRLGVGSDGDQHGIYTDSMERWLIAAEAEGKVFSPGIYANTTSSGSNVRVDTSGTGYLRRYTSSSRRYKEDIADLTDSKLDANRLYDLRAVQFRYKEDYLDYDDQRYGKLVSGFIAEEVEEAYPIAVNYEYEMAEDWEPKFLIPPMLKLIQDQKKKIDELEERIEALERK